MLAYFGYDVKKNDIFLNINTLNDFDFELPKALIAQGPTRPRNNSRLLVYNRLSQTITDDYFYNLEKYLLPRTTLVLNNSKVEKNRLKFDTTEIFILEEIDPTTIRALVKPGKRFKTGITFKHLLDGMELKVKTLKTDVEGIRTLSFNLPLKHATLDKYRLTPLPPYIAQDESLHHAYQTVYAKSTGSKAAPTAGLHFTSSQLEKLSKKHPIVELTLHVGLGTFSPVKSQDISKHIMHFEEYIVSQNAAEQLNQAKSLTAVGTTSLRVLEATGPDFIKSSKKTDIFITPGYKFKSVDSLITNFHLPKSTLLMLVAAYIGSVEEVLRVYNYAIEKRYRFYSFGDAMLIL